MKTPAKRRLRSLARSAVPARAEPIARRAQKRLQRRPVRMGGLRRVTPVSPNFGVHRGTPVDRHYIEDFVSRNGARIRGRVLEVGEALYVREPGAFAARERGDALPPVRPGVEQVDILDLSASNPQVTVVADLTDPAADVPAEAFDCILCTQTLQLVYDLRAAIATLHRALKPGGSLLVTVPGISQIAVPDLIASPGVTSSDYPGGPEALLDFWRLTPAAGKTLCGEFFGDENVTVESHGNVLTSIAFLHGLTVEDLHARELAYSDPGYPLLVGVLATKPSSAQ